MKYTDTLFSFPIRVYDGFSIRKNLRMEEKLIEDMDSPMPDDWVEGVAEIPLKEVCGCFDHFSSGRKVSEVAKEGFDATIVMTHNLGDFTCTLSRKRFRDRLNEFAEKYEKMIDQLAEELFERKPLPPPKKKGWFKRFFA